MTRARQSHRLAYPLVPLKGAGDFTTHVLIGAGCIEVRAACGTVIRLSPKAAAALSSELDLAIANWHDEQQRRGLGLPPGDGVVR